MSEFIQGPLPDKDSKSSKFSSHDNLTNLSPPTDIQGGNQNSGVYQNLPKDQSYQRKKEGSSRDFDSSASWNGKEKVIFVGLEYCIEGEQNILRYSDMQALIRNQEKQARQPVKNPPALFGE